MGRGGVWNRGGAERTSTNPAPRWRRTACSATSRRLQRLHRGLGSVMAPVLEKARRTRALLQLRGFPQRL